ncbi:MAG: hypothetical protein R3D88_04820 [Alphaproteobacteria bacterium]
MEVDMRCLCFLIFIVLVFPATAQAGEGNIAKCLSSLKYYKKALQERSDFNSEVLDSMAGQLGLENSLSEGDWKLLRRFFENQDELSPSGSKQDANSCIGLGISSANMKILNKISLEQIPSPIDKVARQCAEGIGITIAYYEHKYPKQVAFDKATELGNWFGSGLAFYKHLAVTPPSVEAHDLPVIAEKAVSKIMSSESEAEFVGQLKASLDACEWLGMDTMGIYQTLK